MKDVETFFNVHILIFAVNQEGEPGPTEDVMER